MLLTILTEGYPYVMLEYSQVTNQIALYLKKLSPLSLEQCIKQDGCSAAMY